MISTKEMIIDQQNLIDLLLALHRKFKEDPTTGNPLDLSRCLVQNVTIRGFDFEGVHCNGTQFDDVDFLDIKNPPWKTPSYSLYIRCRGITP